MPADTPLKRHSAMNISCPWRGCNVVPQLSIAAGERAAVMYLYAMAGGPPQDSPGNADMGIRIGYPWPGHGAIGIGWGF